MTKPTLFLITVAGLVAAVLAASCLPASPLTAAAIGYAAVVGTLAHAVGAPVWRTLGASVLVVAVTLAVVLRAVRHVIDIAVWVLTAGTGVALTTAKATA